MSDDDPGGRIDFVDGLLECIGRMIPASVSRKDRKELTKRTDALLEDLDKQESAEWLVSVWMEEQAVAVVEASEALWAAEKTPDMFSSDVASIVSSVLSALEEVMASHVDKAEVLLASMQGGESDQVVAVLEHGLTLLEKLSSASTRKTRKPIDELCEHGRFTMPFTRLACSWVQLSALFIFHGRARTQRRWGRQRPRWRH